MNMSRKYLLLPLILAVGAGTFFIANNNSGAKILSLFESSKLITSAYDPAPFTNLKLHGSDTLLIEIGGDKPSLTISGNACLLKLAKIEQSGDTLTLTRKNEGYKECKDYKGLTFLLRTPSLPNLDLLGSGDIVANNAANDTITANLQGSGDIVLRNISGKKGNFVLLGSGNYILEGKLAETSLTLTGSGDIDASGLEAGTLEANLLGSGNISGNAHGAAQLNITGSGDVDIKGAKPCNVRVLGPGNGRCS